MVLSLQLAVLSILRLIFSDINKIHLGIGDKMGTFIQWMSGFFAGFAIGFAYGWKLTLVILAISPVLAGVALLMSKVGAQEESLGGLDSHDLPYLPPPDEELCI